MSYHLIDGVQRLGRPRVLVTGDLILDRYVWGEAERVSQEAPVILLRQQKQEDRLGGAANVAQMILGLEADVAVAGVVGTDADAKVTRDLLTEMGADCGGVISDPARPTTVKERYLGRAAHRHPHQMLRVDREVRTPISESVAHSMGDWIIGQLDDVQAVLISDYAKGVCTPELLERVISEARSRDLPVIADPPSTAQCDHYRGATAITPNRTETSRAVAFEIEGPADAFRAGKLLCERHDLERAFVTMDSAGMAVVPATGEAEFFPTRKREVYDVTGAGDMVLATIGVGAAAGLPPADLARLANVAGGLEVEQVGVIAIRRDEIIADLLSAGRSAGEKSCTLDEVARHVAARKRLGQRIVLTNGCFDVLHVGHVYYLQQAAREGDCLVVAVNSDDSVRGLGKAPDRPIFAESQRAAMLSALEAVDYVVVFDDATPHSVIEAVRPDVLVKGGTYKDKTEIVGWEAVEAYGGMVKPMGVIDGISTTDILKQLRGESNAMPTTIPLPAATQDRAA